MPGLLALHERVREGELEGERKGEIRREREREEVIWKENERERYCSAL